MKSIVAMVPACSFRRARWVEWVLWNGSHVANDDKRRNCVALGGGGSEVYCVEEVVSREVWETYACVCP
jgi:hypothetical protein